MKIGISNASLYPIETEKTLEFLCENGVEVTEIFVNSLSEIEPQFVKKLHHLSKTYGVEISSIHPCGSVAEPYMLFSDYERRYRETFDFYCKYYQAAELLGAKVVVLHGDSLSGHIDMEQYCERLMEMNDAAAKFGVTVSHENVSRYRGATPENIKLLRRLTNDRLKFTYDIKQSIRAGFEPASVYEAMRGNIVNVHISDNKEGNECMLPGEGGFDFAELFKKLKNDGYEGSCVIEVYKNAYDSKDELIKAYNSVKQIHKNC